MQVFVVPELLANILGSYHILPCFVILVVRQFKFVLFDDKK
jgi:hypothetical protein